MCRFMNVLTQVSRIQNVYESSRFPVRVVIYVDIEVSRYYKLSADGNCILKQSRKQIYKHSKR